MPDELDADLLALMHAIAAGKTAAALNWLRRNPALATRAVEIGASRRGPPQAFMEEIGQHAYAGATALHIASAAHNSAMVGKLLTMGADVDARDRRGASPIHAAAVGRPAAPNWDPRAQAATIRLLIKQGADPNCVASGGVTPLHRAVRTRSAAAVRALLAGGADAHRKSKSGSTPVELAGLTTGRSGSGSPEAKKQQREILRLFAADD
jgi:ankyrin repeat protein